MIDLTAKIDISGATRLLRAAPKQIAFANMLALNQVAKSIQDKERTGILATFANPRPFTVNSVGVVRATKTNLFATIFIKDKTAAYLDPYEFGGGHFIPNRPELGRVLLEPVHLPVDQYGQMRKGLIDKLLARPDVFVATIHGVLGIWQRVKPPAKPKQRGFRLLDLPTSPAAAAPRLVLLAKVIANREVPKHLNFDVRGLATFYDEYPALFGAAIIKALATAR